MFEQIYRRPRVIERHRQAPLRLAREQYLRHMLEKGYTHRALTTSAAYMLQLVRILGLHELRVVYEDEIKHAAEVWAEYQGPFRHPGHCNHRSPRSFIKFVRAWLRFHGKLALPSVPPFLEQTQAFSHSLQVNYGLAEATVRGYSNRAQAFLTWLAAQGGDLEAVSVADIDKFILAKRVEGWTPRGIGNQCQALRSFFRFAETRGWSAPNLALAIRIPRIPKDKPYPVGPTWPQVRQIIKLAEGCEPEHLRAKALLLLFTVYGLRSGEVIHLRLEDFDWRSEVFTVRRSKHAGTQQYPIQYEVGEAILKYLQYARPQVENRHVFLGERRPWGPLLHTTVWRTVAKRLRILGIELDHRGPHALRHACATRLLKKGSSLKEIADFLGHRDTRSVGIYAKCDIAALRKVAAFRLAGLQ
ncbi:site-specific integrase [Terriglobus albidus]|uniref:site-specific integrase n=1 Tax=Terriglobus albidus TaxID=1592106 RepID=UPI0021E02BE6|nr:site-specific integrase [Terriglobus albidus]